MDKEHSKPTKQKVAFVVDYCDEKGWYSFERAAILANLLVDESIFVFLKGANPRAIQFFMDRGMTPVLYDHLHELPKALRNLRIDCIVYEGKDSTVELLEALRPFCHTLVHFDDFGEGAVLADGNVIALYEEPSELHVTNRLAGSYAFAVPELLPAVAELRQAHSMDAVPHIVIAFEDGDPFNLTYRTLRHLTQLHIPLQISVVIDADYRHAVADLQLMMLTRRNTSLLQDDYALYNVMSHADIIICNANYTPYKVAAVGIPCIAVAQHEREIKNAFVREENGMIHLGLGRKMKQSHIQNAVMELLLHGSRRDRAVRKQLELNIGSNNEILSALLQDFVHNRHNIAHI